MSEFTCANGHLMRSGQLRCPECGARLTYMDGKNEDELRAEEGFPPRRNFRSNAERRRFEYNRRNK